MDGVKVKRVFQISGGVEKDVKTMSFRTCLPAPGGMRNLENFYLDSGSEAGMTYKPLSAYTV